MKTAAKRMEQSKSITSIFFTRCVIRFAYACNHSLLRLFTGLIKAAFIER